MLELLDKIVRKIRFNDPFEALVFIIIFYAIGKVANPGLPFPPSVGNQFKRDVEWFIEEIENCGKDDKCIDKVIENLKARVKSRW